MKRKILIPILAIILIIVSATSITIGIILNNPDEDIAIIEESDIPGSEPPYNFDYSWTKYPYVAHAFGGILGTSYTNSYEAFLLNYQLGHRVFETDFFITDDGHTVAAHDSSNWREKATVLPISDSQNSSIDPSKFTYDNFMSSLWYDKYHPVSLTTLFKLLQEHPDVYIITDTKFTDKEHVHQQFTDFVAAANTIDSTLLDHIIVQIYSPDMLDWIMDIYHWKSIIYTLYQNPNWTPENVLAFSKASGVKFITMWDTWLTTDISDLWKTSGIKIATHTLNNLTQANNSRTRGADIIYTDFLLP